MPGSIVKPYSQSWLCSSAEDGPVHAGVYWDRCSQRTQKLALLGMRNQPVAGWGGKAVICNKMDPDHRFRASSPL